MKSIFSVSHKALIALLASAAMLLGGSAYAQNAIKGSVADTKGEPIIGASVMVQGTTTGAVTDLDGQFEIKAAPGASLEVSCIGYATKVVPAADGIKVTLEEDSEFLEETVVIGYGTVKVRDLTGSVSTVANKDLQTPGANVAQALQGKMAGVVVTMNDGTPGAEPTIRVRGSKSITQSNDPLYIVDGFPMSSLASVPADQIKSINVLKDAAATAIYGSRGAAGVVIVTTKNALEGQTQVTYNGYIQFKDSSMNVRDVMDPLDYIKYSLGYARDYNSSNYIDQLKYFGMSDAYGNNYGNNYSYYAGTETHNYQSDLYKNAIQHSHNVTVSNGTKKNKTILNLNFMNDDGTVINSYYQRINASLKTVEQLTDNLSIEANVSYAHTNSRNAQRVSTAYRYRPIDNPQGDATLVSGFGNGSSANVEDAANPVELTWNEQDNSYTDVFRAIGAINWKPVKGLDLRSEIGLGKTFGKNEYYDGGYGNNTNSATLRRSESANLHWTTTAQYELPLSGDHHADIMVGNEMITSSGSYMQFYGYEYPSNFDRETTFAMMNQFTNSYTYTTNVSVPGRSVSFFGRANYNYKDRYLFTGTLRADGSSKFAPNNRWGIFPAAAFAWRVIDEPFMSNTKDWLSNLKFRLSYGATGSDAISANLWKETWSLSSSNSDWSIAQTLTDTNSGYGTYYAPGSMMMNADLKWETTITRNAGIDFGLFDERIYGTVEGYWSTTKDLLMPVAVNDASGYSYQYQNMGTVSNRGIELSIGGDIIRNHDFTLSANLIYSYNRNIIEELAESVLVTEYGQWASSSHSPSNGEFVLREGSGMGFIRAYKYLGWYTVDDFNYDASTGMYTLKEGIPDYGNDSYWTSFNIPAGQSAFPGAVKIEDIDGDGVLTEADLYDVGEMTPRHTGAFNLNARWKNWDLSANFNYSIGGMIMNYQALVSSFGDKDNNFGMNRLSEVSGAYSPYRWNSSGQLEFVSDPTELTKMNENATMHMPSSMKGFLLDKYLEDASYLRLKNLSIGYTLPQNISKKFGVKTLRIYGTATNLWTLTKYTGLDPEVNTNSSRSMGGYSLPSPGIDNSAYPIAKAYTLGVNITL